MNFERKDIEPDPIRLRILSALCERHGETSGARRPEATLPEVCGRARLDRSR